MCYHLITQLRDLREHTDDLIHDAEKGKLSLVTKRGKPVFLAVPFSEDLIRTGLNNILAVSLFREGLITLEKAANLADQSIEAFLEKLGKLGISVVNYYTEELHKELKSFD